MSGVTQSGIKKFFLTRNMMECVRKKLRKIQMNGGIYHVHGLEELTSLKCPYYPKQSIDSMQFLLKYQ